MSMVYTNKNKRGVTKILLNGEVFLRLEDIKDIMREFGERFWRTDSNEDLIK